MTKRKRDALFWRLSSKEKAMSLILSKAPIFQRELTKSMTLPSLEDLLSNCPRYPTDGMPVLFEAHYEHQMALLSRIQIDAWHCLPGQESQSVPRVRKDLETWYTHAKKVNLCLLLKTLSKTHTVNRSSKPLPSPRNRFSAPTALHAWS